MSDFARLCLTLLDYVDFVVFSSTGFTECKYIQQAYIEPNMHLFSL